MQKPASRRSRTFRMTLALSAALAICSTGFAFGGGQVKEIIKILGVGAAVKQFGPDINKAINNLTDHKDTNASYTKVVPIIKIGLNTRGAIGAAQVMGSKVNVDKVKSVAAPEAGLFGDEIRIQALIPVATDNPTDAKGLKAVDGVGVSGIVDLKL
ncbi:MAG: hypothetical protein JNM28_10450 [Armatimonadetes bacterium]|nr:hypothetical protein [Armatimonadota bacterium]MBS1710516.1 hypothetical protein [Armatimonadota bacterium]MBX3108187.1 hypothetical protein [Fimbriimonadaceae bacterium]